MTKSHPAGGSRTLIGLLSTFALVGGVVGLQQAASAEEQAAALAARGLGATDAATPTAPATVDQSAEVDTVAPEAPATVPVVDQSAAVDAPAPAAPAVPAPAPAPAPAPVQAPPSGTTGGSGG